MFDEAVRRNHARGSLEWLLSVDSTIVRAHQHAAGAPRAPGTGKELDVASSRFTKDYYVQRLVQRPMPHTGLVESCLASRSALPALAEYQLGVCAVSG